MPVRTCVGCNKKKEKSELVRLVCAGGSPVIDDSGCLSGRGAYICRSVECIMSVAAKKGRLSRAFKKETEAPDPDLFRKRLGL